MKLFYSNIYVAYFDYIYVLFFYRGKQWNVCANLEKDKHARDVKFLDNYAMERWEVRFCLLSY